MSSKWQVNMLPHFLIFCPFCSSSLSHFVVLPLLLFLCFLLLIFLSSLPLSPSVPPPVSSFLIICLLFCSSFYLVLLLLLSVTFGHLVSVVLKKLINIFVPWRTLSSRDFWKTENTAHWPRGTLYLQRLALTSPTSGGRSIIIVPSWTRATFFFLRVQDTVTALLAPPCDLGGGGVLLMVIETVWSIPERVGWRNSVAMPDGRSTDPSRSATLAIMKEAGLASMETIF
jgi:hypothetical protein